MKQTHDLNLVRIIHILEEDLITDEVQTMHDTAPGIKTFPYPKKPYEEAQEIVSERETRKLSEETIKCYRAEFRRLREKHSDVWVPAKITTSKRTWYLRRAAILFNIYDKLKGTLQNLDELQSYMVRGGGGITIPNIARLEHLKNQIKVLEKTYNEAPDYLPLVTKKPRQSKRRMGKGLPNDWRDQLADRLPNWRVQYLAAMITGCRPSELLKGVTLTIQAGNLVAQIKGAKIGPVSGQPERTMQWPIEKLPEVTRNLAQEVARAGGRLVVDLTTGRYNNNPKQAFSDAIKAAAKRIWPNRKLSITAYSLRHAAASDLKASHLSSADISAALGHAAIATKSTYGWALGARGDSVAPKTVEATNPVRGRPSTWAPSQREHFPRERG